MARFTRIAAALILTLALSVSPIFAAANIVSPVANTVVEADSLLVSVKVTGSEKVDITVYRVYYESSPAVYEIVEPEPDEQGTSAEISSDSEIEVSGSAIDEESGAEPVSEEDDAGKAQAPVDQAAEGSPGEGAGDDEEPERILVKEAEYSPVDASALTPEDLVKIAAGERFDEDDEPILLSDGSAIPEYSDRVYASTVRYNNDSEIGFYTKQLTGVKPGLYKVVVKGSSSGRTSCYVAVKEKQEEPEKSNIFTTQKSGALQFLRNMLKSLFR